LQKLSGDFPYGFFHTKIVATAEYNNLKQSKQNKKEQREKPLQIHATARF